jgi:hypothetical protein
MPKRQIAYVDSRDLQLCSQRDIFKGVTLGKAERPSQRVCLTQKRCELVAGCGGC